MRDPTFMTSEGTQTFSTGCVPQAQGTISGPRKNHLPIRTEGNMRDPTFMTSEGTQTFSSSYIPQMNGRTIVI